MYFFEFYFSFSPEKTQEKKSKQVKNKSNHDFDLLQKYENYNANIFNMTIIKNSDFQSHDLHLTCDFYKNLTKRTFFLTIKKQKVQSNLYFLEIGRLNNFLMFLTLSQYPKIYFEIIYAPNDNQTTFYGFENDVLGKEQTKKIQTTKETVVMNAKSEEKY
ncbi:hypothetical protein BpHYR1_004646 [Brachionus plicatilis]|uniref:Uncharacterized protein n=1 Tax=Brachionus plicatilis TaxID=10195 RepID=A0A3M7S7A3_BRAPC|nr:hypothetical protein BpHYR1_004646 [Brachionus plicatilis]